MKNRIAAAVAALALALSGALAGAFVATGAATAQASFDLPICATWKARGATGVYPAIVFGPAPAGTSLSERSATVTKPVGIAPGVELATYNAGVRESAADRAVRVEYSTADGASADSGAIRLFGYAAKDADTVNDAPDWQAVATSGDGSMSFSLPAGEQIGTLGLVFDASNDTRGSVTFSRMTIGTRPVRFTSCGTPMTNSPAPATSTGAPRPSSTITVTPTRTPTQVPTTPTRTTPPPMTTPVSTPTTTAPTPDNPPQETATPTPIETVSDAPMVPVADNGTSLPLTGSSVFLLAGGGLLVAAAGGWLYHIARSRKVTFRG